MFHFPGCPPHKLLIHLWVTGHYPSRVPPFGYPWIKAYLQLPMAFRSLSRPSSAISALASTLRSYSLDLASSVSIAFLRLLRCDTYFDLCFPVSSASLLTGIFRFTVSTFAEISFFSCAVFKVRRAFARTHLLPPFLPHRIGFNSLPSALDGLRIWV